jgi:hypothetical protein
MSTIVKGIFTSIWDCQKISTTATLDTETGYLNIDPTDEEVDDSQWHLLKGEKFVDSDGNEYDVCQTCHLHVLKEKDITDTDEEGNELPEIAGVIICSDPYCESNWISEQDTL